MHAATLQAMRPLFATILFVLLALTACGGLGGGPEATVYKFNQYVADGNIDQAITLLGSDCRRMGDQKWRRILEERSSDISEKKGIKKLETQADAPSASGHEEASSDNGEVNAEANAEAEAKAERERQTIRVRTTVTYGNGETESDWVTLVKEEEGWKISCTGK